MKTLARLALVISLVAVVAVINVGHVLGAGRIFSVPASKTLPEGVATTVSVRLDEPIICSVMDSGCGVDLTFVSSKPSQVTDGQSIHWAANEWNQFRTMTISTTNDHIYTGDQTITLSATAVSNSEYYNGFTITIPVTLTELSDPPAPALEDKTVDAVSGKTTEVDVLDGIDDVDPDTLSIVSGPAHGTAEIGSIIYTPNNGFVGSDSVTYQVCSIFDDSICSTATLNFNVLAAETTAVSNIDPPDTGYGQPTNNLVAYFSIITGLVLVGLALRKYNSH